MKQRYRTLQMVFISLLMSATVATIVLMLTAGQQFETLKFDYSYQDIYLVIGLVVAIVSILLGPVLYKTMVRKIKESDSSESKMNSFYSASVINWAFLEAAILLNAVFLFQNGNSAHLALIAVLMFFMVTRVPSKSRAVKDMKLNEEESRSL